MVVVVEVEEKVKVPAEEQPEAGSPQSKTSPFLPPPSTQKDHLTS